MGTAFGQRLKELRETKGWTLEELAKRIVSTKSYIWELENKPSIRPSVETAYKLAKALDTTIGVLTGEPEETEIPPEDQAFFRNYRQLGQDTKKQLARILDALKKEDD